MPLVSYTEFYNSTLDHIDLMKEYLTWQSPDRPGQFSYCQYPFILSIAAKRFILTKVHIGICESFRTCNMSINFAQRIQSSRWSWRPDVLSFRKCHVISHRGWNSSSSTFTSVAPTLSSTRSTRYVLKQRELRPYKYRWCIFPCLSSMLAVD